MSSTQISEAWNKCFDYKITVANCKKPTQAFLISALECFLKSIHIDCAKIRAKMDERQYKITLVKYFNEFLSTTDHSHSIKFLYGDLLQPDSKKTRMLLQFLTNYYIFFDMVKTDVIGTANERIATYNKLLAEKTKLQLKHEEDKIKLENKEKAMKEYTRLIAESKQLIEELKAKSESLTNSTDAATQQLHQIREENIKLECLKKELDALVVSPDELESMMKSVKELDDEIAELNATENILRSNNQGHVDDINRMTAEIEEFGKINENVIVESVEKYREEMKSMNEMNNKMQEYINQIENTKGQKEEFVKNIQSLKVQLLKKKCELNSVIEESQNRKLAMESERRDRAIHNGNLENKLEAAEQNIEQLKLYQDQLITKGIEIIDFIENS